MDDVLTVADKISAKISESETIRNDIPGLVGDYALAKGAYEKAVAKYMIQLVAGVEFELDGVKTGHVIASNCEKIARGLAYQECITLELRERSLKCQHARLDAVSAELNGWQSIFKHLANPS